MKTHLLHIAIAVLLAFIISFSGNAQNRRDHHHQRENSHQHYRKPHKHRYSPEVKPQNKHYHNHHKRHEHYQPYGHDIRPHQKHNQWRSNHPHHRKHTKERYFHRHLPTKQHLVFNIGHERYYHCNNRFYGYYPGKGYYETMVALQFINYLPRHSHRIIIAGNCYYSYRGYYYIPYHNGYLMIPKSNCNLNTCMSRL